MKPAAVRLLICVALLGGWLGYLGYQVATRPRRIQVGLETAVPLVLSRPQVLASQLDVVARLPEPRGGPVPVTVVSVLYPPEGAGVKEGDEILVANLEDCRPSGHNPDRPNQPDWSGPGEYLLLLEPAGKGQTGKERYEVTPIPPSPGYPGGGLLSPGPPRIYPANQQALAMYRHLRSRKGER
jgi:hypothetical protein